MQADVGFSLFEILRSLQQVGYEGAPQEWMSELRERNDVKDAEIARKCEEPTCDGYMNPLKALSVLDKVTFFKALNYRHFIGSFIGDTKPNRFYFFLLAVVFDFKRFLRIGFL